jgi:hypothetical protein
MDSGLYESILAGSGDELQAQKALYAQAGSSTNLAEEIRLARCRLALALQEGDDKRVLAWLAMIHALVRVQEGLTEESSELRTILERAGEEVRRTAT